MAFHAAKVIFFWRRNALFGEFFLFLPPQNNSCHLYCGNNFKRENGRLSRGKHELMRLGMLFAKHFPAAYNT